MAFSPSSISNCVLWLDASRLALANGALVTSWPSSGPVAYTATATSGREPTYTQNVLNGLGCVTYATGRTTVLSNFVLGQKMSVFQLSYPIGQAIHPFLEHGPDTNTNPGFYLHSGGLQNYFINNVTSAFVNTGSIGTTNTWLLMEGVNVDTNAASTMGFYSNSYLVASNSTQTSNTPLTQTLFLNGRNNTNTVSYPGYVAEIIIYDTPLTAGQRQQVEGYLVWKWGLQSILPGSHPYKYAPVPSVQATPIVIPTSASVIPINTFSSIKTVRLPSASTIPGQWLFLKDYLGFANYNPITLCTTGIDTFERSNISSIRLSNAFGTYQLTNDGQSRWYLLQTYLNSLNFQYAYIFDRTSFVASNFTLVNNASIVGTELRVLNNVVSSNGAAWNPQKVNIDSFGTTFRLRFEVTNAQGGCFVIQNTASNTIGLNNTGLGYQGIGRSVAIRFDTNSGTLGQFSTDILSNGAAFAQLGASGVLNSQLGLTANTTWSFLVNVLYASGTLSYSITNVSTNAVFTSNLAIDIPNIVGAPTAWMGFTAGSGTTTAVMRMFITSWNLSNL